MPDVLAMPLNIAVKILLNAGWEYRVVHISSGYRQEDRENCLTEEYVVRQQQLSVHIILLSTMMKRRKEVLEHGFQN